MAAGDEDDPIDLSGSTQSGQGIEVGWDPDQGVVGGYDPDDDLFGENDPDSAVSNLDLEITGGPAGAPAGGYGAGTIHSLQNLNAAINLMKSMGFFKNNADAGAGPGYMAPYDALSIIQAMQKFTGGPAINSLPPQMTPQLVPVLKQQLDKIAPVTKDPSGKGYTVTVAPQYQSLLGLPIHQDPTGTFTDPDLYNDDSIRKNQDLPPPLFFDEFSTELPGLFDTRVPINKPPIDTGGQVGPITPPIDNGGQVGPITPPIDQGGQVGPMDQGGGSIFNPADFSMDGGPGASFVNPADFAMGGADQIPPQMSQRDLITQALMDQQGGAYA